MPFDAVLFDMDGTLLDTEALYLAAFVAAATEAGLAAPESFGRSLIGVHSAECVTRIHAAMPDRAGPRLVEDWYARVESLMAAGIALKPGAAEVVKELTARGYPLAVVTSSNSDNAALHLAQAGLLPHFAFVIGGNHVTRRKPHPEPYLMAIERLGHAPGRVLAVEDSAAGVRSAHGAGAQVMQVPDINPPDSDLIALGHHVAPSIEAGFASFGITF